MSIRVTSTLDGLDRDLRALPAKAARKTAKVVRDNAREGNKTAKALAKVSAGKHGKLYHRAFTAEALSPFKWEYGPDASKPQGGMSFEYGSRNQPPHLDLNRSADVQGVKFGQSVRDALDELFW